MQFLNVDLTLARRLLCGWNYCGIFIGEAAMYFYRNYPQGKGAWSAFLINLLQGIDVDGVAS